MKAKIIRHISGSEHKTEWVIERHGNFRVCKIAGDESERLSRVLLPDPEHFFRLGEKVESGRHGNPRDLVRVTVDDRSYLIKRYNCRGWSYRVKNVFRFSRARRCLLAGQVLLDHGIHTPQPLLSLDQRNWRLLGDSYLVTPFLDDAVSLLELWPELDARWQARYLQSAGALFGRLHRLGIIHGDTNWRNILVRPHSQKPEFWLVDLDGMRSYKRMSADRAIRDVGHFLRDLGRNGGDENAAALFRNHWQRAMDINLPGLG